MLHTNSASSDKSSTLTLTLGFGL